LEQNPYVFKHLQKVPDHLETLLLEKLFRHCYNETPDRINPLKGDASDRRIYRMQNANRSVIGIAGDNRAENEAFVQFSRHFKSFSLPVPEIYAADLDNGIYLEQDLGLFTLYEWMAPIRDKHGFTAEIIAMYKQALYFLPRFQIVAGRSLDYSFCYQHASFARASMSWDLEYFQHRFVANFYKQVFDKDALKREFLVLVDHLLEEGADYFLYRDCQSRNIMIHDQNPYFIDYQSGRRGALQYDLASLVYDAKADLPEEQRAELIQYYMHACSEHINLDEKRFLHYFYSFVLIRVLQAFGAYGYLAAVKGKKNFLKSVPFALKNAALLLQKAHILNRMPVLRKILADLVDDESLYRY
jgi:aminoglycoside/choline kinase family phosphotransferase